MNLIKRAMRDVFIETLTDRMIDDDRLFFLTADFGSPALDRLKELCGNRFINVGIAEQNLINVASGLALEGIFCMLMLSHHLLQCVVLNR